MSPGWGEPNFFNLLLWAKFGQMYPTNLLEFDLNFDSEGQPNSTRFWTLRAQPDPKTGWAGSNCVY